MGKFEQRFPVPPAMTPGEFGDLFHGLPDWAGGWDDDQVVVPVNGLDIEVCEEVPS